VVAVGGQRLHPEIHGDGQRFLAAATTFVHPQGSTRRRLAQYLARPPLVPTLLMVPR
jgi:hypothetical protein